MIDVGKSETEVVKLDIWDVAKGLENVKRFNGQHPYNPNVCQHSLGVYNLAVFYEQSPRIQAGCLFHDCAEMILGDVSSPVKHEMRVFLGGNNPYSSFDAVELDWQYSMFHHFFGFLPTKKEWKIIKKYDEMSFAFEVGQWANRQCARPDHGSHDEYYSIRFIEAYDRIKKALG